jgi:hemerythrin
MLGTSVFDGSRARPNVVEAKCRRRVWAMSYVRWTPDLSVGVKASDDDHKRLIDLINRLFEALNCGQGREIVGKVLDELESYTRYHFAREEEYFERTGYPADEHKQEHRELVEQIVTLQSRYRTGETALAMETLGVLKHWLTTHIQGTDMKYTGHLNANGIH